MDNFLLNTGVTDKEVENARNHPSHFWLDSYDGFRKTLASTHAEILAECDEQKSMYKPVFDAIHNLMLMWKLNRAKTTRDLLFSVAEDFTVGQMAWSFIEQAQPDQTLAEFINAYEA